MKWCPKCLRRRTDHAAHEQRVDELEAETREAVERARRVVDLIRARHDRNHYGETYDQLYRGRRRA